jgi:hypothetical protein
MTIPSQLTPDLAAGVALHATLVGTMVSSLLRSDHQADVHYHKCIDKSF